MGQEERVESDNDRILFIDGTTGKPATEEQLNEYCETLRNQYRCPEEEGTGKRKRSVRRIVITEQDIYKVIRDLMAELHTDKIKMYAVVATICELKRTCGEKRVMKKVTKLINKLETLRIDADSEDTIWITKVK
jgi:hypothetical protein